MADLSFPGVRNHVHPVNAAQEAALRRLGWADATPTVEPTAEADEAPDAAPETDAEPAPEIPDLPPPPPPADQES